MAQKEFRKPPRYMVGDIDLLVLSVASIRSV